MENIVIYTATFGLGGKRTLASTTEFHPGHPGVKKTIQVVLPTGFDFCKIRVNMDDYGLESCDEMEIVDKNGFTLDEFTVIDGEIFLIDADGVKHLCEAVKNEA